MKMTISTQSPRSRSWIISIPKCWTWWKSWESYRVSRKQVTKNPRRIWVFATMLLKRSGYGAKGGSNCSLARAKNSFCIHFSCKLPRLFCLHVVRQYHTCGFIWERSGVSPLSCWSAASPMEKSMLLRHISAVRKWNWSMSMRIFKGWRKRLDGIQNNTLICINDPL